MKDESPILIIQKGDKQTTLSEGSLKQHTEELLNFLMQDVRRVKDFNKQLSLVRALTEVKKAYWPAVSKSISATATIPFEKQVQQFLELRKEEKKIEKQITFSLEKEDAD